MPVTLPETTLYEPIIQGIATSDLLLGGVAGGLNVAVGQLANRTKYFKQLLSHDAVTGVMTLHTPPGTTGGGQVLNMDATIVHSWAGLSYNNVIVGTGQQYLQIGNSGGRLYAGVERSAGGGIIAGSTGYDAFLIAQTGLTLSANGGTSVHARLSTTGLLTIGTAFYAAGTVLGLEAISTHASNNAFRMGVAANCHATVASSQATFGAQICVFLDHTSGTTTGIPIGLTANLNAVGNGGTTTDATALQGIAAVTTGATVTNLRLIRALMGTASGTITNLYAIYIDNVTAGGTLNYAIKSKGGRVGLENLPVSAAGLAAGDLWNNAGVLNIV